MKSLTINDVTYEIVDKTARNGVAGIPEAVNTALAEAKESGAFKGDKGDSGPAGTSGVSPTVNVSKAGKVTTLTITDAEGTKTATINDGSDGGTGPTGPAGPAGKDGKDYVLTAADKAEIAEQVDGATIVQAPQHVESTDKMTDTSKVYVLAETGHIWAYMDTTVEKEVTVRDDIIGTTDNPYQVGRLSSGGALSNDVNTHTLTPFIDITKAAYQGKTIQIHLEGNRYASESNETYIMAATFDTAKAVIVGRAYTDLSKANFLGGFDNAGMTLEIHGEKSATLTFPVPLVEDGGKTVGYFRFCGLGTVTDSVYITYTAKETVTGGQWVDTGTTYAPTLTDADKQAMVDEIVEQVDTQLLTMIGDGMVTV